MRISDWSSDVCSSDLLAARWPLKPCSQAWAGVGCFLPAVQKYDGSDKIRVGTEREYARRLAGSGSNKGPPEHAESNMIRTHYAHMDRGVPEVRIRTIGLRDLQIALRTGWEDFMDRRGDLVFVGFIYPIVGFLAVAIARHWTLLPIFFPLVAGLTLVGPAVQSGFYELARRRERGMDARDRKSTRLKSSH